MAGKDSNKPNRAPSPSSSYSPNNTITYTTVTIHRTDLWNLLQVELVQRTISWFALRLFSAAPLAFFFAWRQQRRRRRLLKAKNKTPQGIAGSESSVLTLRTHVVTALRNSHALRKLKIPPVHGITVSGPSGCGKLELIKMLCKESGAYFICMHVRELQTVEDTEAAFQEAMQNAAFGRGVVLVLARIDLLNEFGAHVVASLMDELACSDRKSRIKVLGTCTKVQHIDPQLRRVGRFELDVQLSDPTPEDRQEIFKLHTNSMELDSDVDFKWLAEKTPGYSGSDIALVCSLAQQNALKQKIQQVSKDEEVIEPKDLNDGVIKATKEDFEKALKDVDRPTTLREFKIEVPEVQWEDIGGLDEVKREVRDLVQIPVQYPEVFKKLNVNPPKGLLLFGPPGCGKTMVARAIAKQCSANFISIKGPELVSMWYGESAKGVERVFDRARQSSPCVLFFDEFDSIAQPRGQAIYSSGASTENDRIVAQLLNEMDGLQQDKLVFVVAATNSPDGVDTALLRPGRFDEIVYVPLPNDESRKQIFKNALKNATLDEQIDLDELVRRTEGYSGADISYVCKRAFKLAFRDAVSGVVEQQEKQKQKSKRQLINEATNDSSKASDSQKTPTTYVSEISLENNQIAQNHVDIQFEYDNTDSNLESSFVKLQLNYEKDSSGQNVTAPNGMTREIDFDEEIYQKPRIIDTQKKSQLMDGIYAALIYCLLPIPGKKLVPLLRIGLMTPMLIVMALDTVFPWKQRSQSVDEQDESIIAQASQSIETREVQFDSRKVTRSESSFEQQSSSSLIANDSTNNTSNQIKENLKISKQHMETALKDSRRSVSEMQSKHYEKLAESLKRQGAFAADGDPPDGLYT